MYKYGRVQFSKYRRRQLIVTTHGRQGQCSNMAQAEKKKYKDEMKVLSKKNLLLLCVATAQKDQAPPQQTLG